MPSQQWVDTHHEINGPTWRLASDPMWATRQVWLMYYKNRGPEWIDWREGSTVQTKIGAQVRLA